MVLGDGFIAIAALGLRLLVAAKGFVSDGGAFEGTGLRQDGVKKMSVVSAILVSS